MTRGGITYLLVCAVIIALLVGRAINKPKPIDWSQNLSRYYRSPYGTELLYERLPDLFKGPISTSHDRLRQVEWMRDRSSGPETHMILMSSFFPDGRETTSLLTLANDGDDVFIAASALSDTLETMLGVHITESVGLAEKLTVRFRDLPQETHAFTLEKAFYNTAFDSLPEGSTILAVNGSSEPLFVHIPYGEGHFWLCTVPLAFTNYQLLKAPNERFISTVLSFLPATNPVLWNEHYKVGRLGRETPLRWLLSNTATRWAVYLAMTLLLLYILLRTKREQRAVPIIEPLRNSSRDFVRTVGNLYFRKGDHADLARKMILYFKEDLRQRTYLRHFAYDAPTYQHLAVKLAMTEEEIRNRLERVATIEHATRIDQEQLLALNKELGDLRARI